MDQRESEPIALQNMPKHLVVLGVELHYRTAHVFRLLSILSDEISKRLFRFGWAVTWNKDKG